jgi:uncharacterized protein YjbJ (UPF0337 family)
MTDGVNGFELLGNFPNRRCLLNDAAWAAVEQQGASRMDEHRVKGAAKEIKGGVKDAAGKIVGDDKLQAEGKIDKATGKAEKAYGEAKDSLKD